MIRSAPWLAASSGLLTSGVGVHRCLHAAEQLARDGISAAVLDLRSIHPLDTHAIAALADRTGRLVVVDEDYTRGGLTGEIAATLLTAGLAPRYRRVTVDTTIPFAPELEYQTLPNTQRIIAATRELL